MKLKVTVHGVAYEVDVEVLDAGDDMIPAAPLPPMMPSAAAPAPAAAPGPLAAAPRPSAPAPAAAGAGSVTSPIAGTVVEAKCKAGDTVADGDVLIIIEAMKMNTPIAATRAGTVKKVLVGKGDSVREGQSLVEFD